jgi:hypothetical protein
MLSQILLFIFILILSAFPKQIDRNRISLSTGFQKINIFFDNKIRLSGGQPKIESKIISFKNLVKQKDKFNFHTDSNTIEVNFKKCSKAPIVSFFLSPNGNKSVKGNDYLGILFDQIPGYENGVTIWRYKPWNS